MIKGSVATDGVITNGTSIDADSMFSKATDGLLQTLSPDTDVIGISTSEARHAMVALAAGALVTGSMVARKRAAAHQPPIMKVLF